MRGTDVQVRPEQEGAGSPPRVRPEVRSAWNWFGSLFGVVVLFGGSILYLSSDGDPIPGGEQIVAREEAEANDKGDVHEENEGHGGTEGQDEAEPAEAVSDGGSDGASGKGSSAKQAGAKARIIEVEMVEFGYVPEIIDVKAGTRVTLRFMNTGKVVHEAMIGDAHMQEEFAAANDHEGGHADGGHHGDVMAITVEPGKTADLKVVIDEPGEWLIGCHLVGHWEAGMVGRINVT